jgi:O-antigen biosynthesis protein
MSEKNGSHAARMNVAVIFDGVTRPETTGVYCRRALAQLAQATHFHPDMLGEVPRRGFNL